MFSAWLAVPTAADAARVAVGLERGADASACRGSDRAAHGHQGREPEADPRARRRRARRRVAARDPWGSLRRAARDSTPRLHADRPARVEAVVPPVQRLLRAVGHAAGVRADAGRRDRLRRRRVPSRPRGEDPRRARASSAAAARTDSLGHGTFVAGLIAAGLDNGIGIAGLAPSSELLVAKVVTKSRAIPVEAEAKAIRWAVDNGARVINMSLGGVRDPLDPGPRHVLAARGRRGRVCGLERRRRRRGGRQLGPGSDEPVEVRELPGGAAARPRRQRDDRDRRRFRRSRTETSSTTTSPHPACEILSVLPRPLTARFPSCSEQGYSSCGPDEYREAQGTSYAAPQVAAAAAVLLSLRPTLRPEQVTKILQETAVDLSADHRLQRVRRGPGRVLGMGAARRRGGDRSAREAASRAATSTRRTTTSGPARTPVSGSNRRVYAAVDFWDDQDDVYAIRLERNQPVYVGLTGSDRTVDLSLAFWLPQTRSIERVADFKFRVRTSARVGSRQYLSYRPRAHRDVLRPGAHVEPGRHALPPRGRQGLSVGARYISPHVYKSSSSGTSRSTRAGFPTTITRGATSFVTTAPAPTNASSPISIPGQSTAPPPMRAPRRIVGPLTSVVPSLGAPHEVVVRRDDARRDEDVLLERRVRGDVGLGLDLRHRADRRVVLDERAAAEDDVVADRHALAHARLVAEDDARADPRAREHDRAGRDDRPVADLGRRERLALRRRARRERRLLPDDGVLEHLDPVAENRARIDGRGGVDLSGHSATSSACRARARRELRPRRPSADRRLPRRVRRNSRHSSFSGSSVAIFGMWMSPVRVCHSP